MPIPPSNLLSQLTDYITKFSFLSRAPPGVFLPPSPWAWIDPGAFALIGAGAFMGGVTRMTLALAVIIMEVSSLVHRTASVESQRNGMLGKGVICAWAPSCNDLLFFAHPCYHLPEIAMQMSNDVRILLPAMTAIMLAKWVADAASHSLYHGLLEVKCVPFLPKEPATDISMDLLEVRYIMAAPVVTLRERMRLGDVRDVLRSTRHNGFPVVRPAPGSSSSGRSSGGGSRGDDDGVFVGLVARDHLMRLLLEAVRRGTCQHLELAYSELNHQLVDPGVLAAEEEQQMAVLEGRPPTPQHFPSAPALWEEMLDLTPYVNEAAHRVPETFSVERAYLLFSTMGLRHLVVVDEGNRVRGIVTRKDLLGYRLDEGVVKARRGAHLAGGTTPARQLALPLDAP